MDEQPSNRVCARVPGRFPEFDVVLLGEEDTGELGREGCFGDPSGGAAWFLATRTDDFTAYNNGSVRTVPFTVANAAAHVDPDNVEDVFTATLDALYYMTRGIEFLQEHNQFDDADALRQAATSLRRELSYAISVFGVDTYDGLTQAVVLIDARLATGEDRTTFL